MRKVKSVIDFTDGQIVQRINQETAKIIDNIINPETDEKTRKLIVEVQFTPFSDRERVGIKTCVKSKLSPINSVITQMTICQSGDCVLAYEANGLRDGQIDINGEVHETKFIELENEETEE